MKPNLYFTVNVLYSPDLIKRITIKADTPLEAIKQAHNFYRIGIWFTVIGTKIMRYARCCAHCAKREGYCMDYCRRGCPNNICDDGSCTFFESESQTD